MWCPGFEGDPEGELLKALKREVDIKDAELDPFRNTIFHSEATINLFSTMLVGLHLTVLTLYNSVVGIDSVNYMSMVFCMLYATEQGYRVFIYRRYRTGSAVLAKFKHKQGLLTMCTCGGWQKLTEAFQHGAHTLLKLQSDPACFRIQSAHNCQQKGRFLHWDLLILVRSGIPGLEV